MKWKVLAGLRFFLAWVVVGYHLSEFVPNPNKDILCNLGKLNGLAAVFVFLVLSGYGIGHSIAKQTQGFYKRRFWRIYPLYFSAVLFTFIPLLVSSQPVKTLRTDYSLPHIGTVLGNLLFLQNVAVDPIWANVPLWILGVEAICYALTPLLAKLSNKILIALMGLSAVFYGLFTYIYEAIYPKAEVAFYSYFLYGIPLLLLLWSWLLGFLYFRNNETNLWKAILVGLGTVVLIVNQYHTGRLGILTYLIGSLVIVFSPSIKVPKSLDGILNYLGEISYPLYLFHFPTLIFAYTILGVRNSFSHAFLALVVSLVFYHLIEVPVRRLRKKQEG
jgi:peptidoglycan/LPS O-acetylase OafA/YrhL